MLNQMVQDFLRTETDWTQLENEDLLLEFVPFCKEVERAVKSGELISFSRELSEQLKELDFFKASQVAYFLGSACMDTEDMAAGKAILELFSRACPQVYEMLREIEEQEAEELLESPESLLRAYPSGARAYYGFNTLCVALMAFLAKDPELRMALAEAGLSEQTQYLAEEAVDTPYLRSISFVDAMPATCSHQKLLVLSPQREKGFFATANDLKNCFHLLFLLEEQIHKKLCGSYGMEDYRVDSSLVRLAHGEFPKDCWGKCYNTYFMECDYRTACSDRKEVLRSQMIPMIWGEMSPKLIPQVEGYGVIVLWERGFPRSFSGEFMVVDHSSLKPYVKIERELTDEEYAAWLEKIRVQCSLCE